MRRRIAAPRAHRTLVRRVSAGVFALLLLLGCARGPGFACTGFYVGSELSANGSIYFGRSEDIADNYCKVFGVEPAREWPAGSFHEDVYGLRVPYPARTYAYTYVRDSDVHGGSMQDENGEFYGIPYGAAGVNEKGVSVSATVSTACGEAAGEADPLVYEGVREISIPSLLLGASASAREAVEYLARLLDEYGAGECNSLMIGDPGEVWYFEIVSGHQYAAIRLPRDRASLQPNMMLLGAVDTGDSENVVSSPNLRRLAEENGFLVTDASGRIDVARTYGAEPETEQRDRYWQGLCLLSPERAERFDPDDVPTELLLESEGGYTTLEVLRILAERGHGTARDADAGTAVGAIGNSGQSECHVFEIRPGLPPELATLQWQALADAEFSIFVPYYSALLTAVNSKYEVDSAAYVPDSIDWVFSEINAICHDWRAETGVNLPGSGVESYFREYQAEIIDRQRHVDAAMEDLYREDIGLARSVATQLGIDLSEQVFRMADGVLTELRAFIEAGDYSAPFEPSTRTIGLKPEYSVARAMRLLEAQGSSGGGHIPNLPGDGLAPNPPDGACEPDSGSTPNRDAADSRPAAPLLPILGVLAALAVFGALFVLRGAIKHPSE